ncbi:MAG: hypothetical protein IT193_17290 [Propionibacteriaceae bacterium]|nr:hypothetical protein [Propionibacteriaceae bacterium]
MSENLRDLAAELGRVDTAIGKASLYADPANPSAGFSDELVELIVREERVLEQVIQTALKEVSTDETSADPVPS